MKKILMVLSTLLALQGCDKSQLHSGASKENDLDTLYDFSKDPAPTEECGKKNGNEFKPGYRCWFQRPDYPLVWLRLIDREWNRNYNPPVPEPGGTNDNVVWLDERENLYMNILFTPENAYTLDEAIQACSNLGPTYPEGNPLRNVNWHVPSMDRKDFLSKNISWPEHTLMTVQYPKSELALVIRDIVYPPAIFGGPYHENPYNGQTIDTFWSSSLAQEGEYIGPENCYYNCFDPMVGLFLSPRDFHRLTMCVGRRMKQR